jgi:hypothetical protein
MDFLKGFDLTRWWYQLIAVGVIIVPAALAAKERGLLYIALGMIACGFGESLSWGKSIEFTPATIYVPAAQITRWVRYTRPLGIAFDAIGMPLVVFGFWKLLTA